MNKVSKNPREIIFLKLNSEPVLASRNDKNEIGE
jgi:hypothetical protein